MLLKTFPSLFWCCTVVIIWRKKKKRFLAVVFLGNRVELDREWVWHCSLNKTKLFFCIVVLSPWKHLVREKGNIWVMPDSWFVCCVNCESSPSLSTLTTWHFDQLLSCPFPETTSCLLRSKQTVKRESVRTDFVRNDTHLVSPLLLCPNKGRTILCLIWEDDITSEWSSAFPHSVHLSFCTDDMFGMWWLILQGARDLRSTLPKS